MDFLLQRRLLTFILAVLLSAAFAAVSLISYQASRSSLQMVLVQKELPLTSNAIYAELQKDLIRPYFISSMMATNTFLYDWVDSGERDPAVISRYLGETRDKYEVFTSFFVSERTRNYYNADGFLKRVSPDVPIDRWYYRVRAMKDNYEINIDRDSSNPTALAIFMNFRVIDQHGRYLGATGVGLSMNRLHRLLAEYGERYQKRIYLVDPRGDIRLGGETGGPARIRDIPGLGAMAARVLAGSAGNFRYEGAAGPVFLNVRYMPEVRMFLFVEGQEGAEAGRIREALYVNLAICVGIVLLAIVLNDITVRRFRRRLEVMATVDPLTGLMNRQAFELVSERRLAERLRDGKPFALVMADLDYFKQINDRLGHLSGDRLLREVGALLQGAVRDNDLICRWGGEEFLLLLDHCGQEEALRLTDDLRFRLMEQAFVLSGQPQRVTMSLGLTVGRPGDTLQGMVDRADRALYAAKLAGRNRVHVAP